MCDAGIKNAILGLIHHRHRPAYRTRDQIIKLNETKCLSKIGHPKHDKDKPRVQNSVYTG